MYEFLTEFELESFFVLRKTDVLKPYFDTFIPRAL